MFGQLVKFCQESYQELRLATWLTPQQMAQSTLVVIVLTVIVSAYVACIDQALLLVARILFRIG